jgi:two-component system response regulator HydG
MKRILVVDDDAQIVNSLCEYLGSFGYDVDFAYELEEARALIDRRDYDAVITDLRLTRVGFSGLEIVKQIRTSSPRAQVVVLTGHAWPELEEEASAHNLCVFLQKPVPAWQVLKTINLLTGASA